MYKHQHSEMMKNKNSYTASPALSCLRHFLDTVLGVKVLVTRNTLVWLSLQSGSSKNTPKERVPSTFAYGNLLVGFLSGLSQVSPGFWGETSIVSRLTFCSTVCMWVLLLTPEVENCCRLSLLLHSAFNIIDNHTNHDKERSG